MERLERITHSKYWLYLLVLLYGILGSIYFDKLFVDCASEGDIGRDLYYFSLVAQDKLPYIDFNWIYGPLAPMLYGLFFKISGVSIASATHLYYLILTISLFLLFFLMKKLTNSLFAFLTSLGFIINFSLLIQFFNHLLGIPFILLLIYSVYFYLKTFKTKYLLYLSLASIFLGLVKLNMMLAMVFPVYFILFIYLKIKNENFRPLFLSFFSFLSIIALIYAILLLNAPVDQLIKSFPYLPQAHIVISKNVFHLLFTNESHLLSFSKSINPILAFVVNLISIPAWNLLVTITGFIFCILILKTDGIKSPDLVFVSILSTLSLTTMHEFFMAGTIYSLRYWSVIINFILVFYLLYYLLSKFKENKNIIKPVSGCVCVYFVTVIILFFISLEYYNTPVYYFYKNTRLCVGFSGFPWPLYLNSNLEYINKNTGKEDYLFSFPYNILYNFASDRKYPSRYTEFLAMSSITPEDEQKVINDLEKHKVKHILFSAKLGKVSGGFGWIGKTHGRTLIKYISNNYYVDTIIKIDKIKSDIVPITYLVRKTPFIDPVNSSK